MGGPLTTVLLFDTTRLSQSDPSIDPRSPELVKALKRLMDMIRSLGTVDDGMKHMVGIVEMQLIVADRSGPTYN